MTLSQRVIDTADEALALIKSANNTQNAPGRSMWRSPAVSATAAHWRHSSQGVTQCGYRSPQTLKAGTVLCPLARCSSTRHRRQSRTTGLVYSKRAGGISRGGVTAGAAQCMSGVAGRRLRSRATTCLPSLLAPRSRRTQTTQCLLAYLVLQVSAREAGQANNQRSLMLKTSREAWILTP